MQHIHKFPNPVSNNTSLIAPRQHKLAQQMPLEMQEDNIETSNIFSISEPQFEEDLGPFFHHTGALNPEALKAQ
jgi:hypothetical protein